MTALHQAAQKAVEALKDLLDAHARNTLYSGAGHWEQGRDAIFALEDALQQQPEPVAYTDPLYLRIKQLGGTFSAHYERSELFNVPLYTAPPALQEVPREPVALLRKLVDYHFRRRHGFMQQEYEADWNRAREIADAASPSTTQQQEAGSGWRPIETAPLEGEFLACIEVQNVGDGRKWWEQHVLRIDGEFIMIDADYAKGWDLEDYAGWQPLPPPPDAAPSTPAREEALRLAGAAMNTATAPHPALQFASFVLAFTGEGAACYVVHGGWQAMLERFATETIGSTVEKLAEPTHPNAEEWTRWLEHFHDLDEWDRDEGSQPYSFASEVGEISHVVVYRLTAAGLPAVDSQTNPPADEGTT